jgi:hypothetical protein
MFVSIYENKIERKSAGEEMMHAHLDETIVCHSSPMNYLE